MRCSGITILLPLAPATPAGLQESERLWNMQAQAFPSLGGKP